MVVASVAKRRAAMPDTIEAIGNDRDSASNREQSERASSE
jgi:hypothetical protein